MRTPGGVDGAQVYAWIAATAGIGRRLVFITGDIANEETAATPAAAPARPAWKSRFASMTSFPWSRQTMGRAAS